MPQLRGCPTRGRRPWSLAARGLAAAAALLIAGNPAATQTLPEALAYAYQNNPQLQAQRAALRATDEEVPQALSNWRPTVNLSSQAGFNRSALTTSNSLSGEPRTAYGNFYNRSVQLQAAQPVYRGGRTEAQT